MARRGGKPVSVSDSGNRLLTRTTRAEGRALTVTRALWVVLLAGQLLFCLFVATGWQRGFITGAPDLARLLFPFSVGVLLIQTPAAVFLRNQLYKKNWRGFAVTPGGYLTANVIFLASCAGVSLLGLVVVMMDGRLGPPVVVPAAAVAMQVINFPNGRAMEPRAPELGDRPQDR